MKLKIGGLFAALILSCLYPVHCGEELEPVPQQNEFPLYAGVSQTFYDYLESTTVSVDLPTSYSYPIAGISTVIDRYVPEDTQPEAEPAYSEEELLLLAQIIDAEAGASWLSERHRLLAGNVVLNRVASPEYPDTLREVIYQPGQYGPAIRGELDDIEPSEASFAAARRLLEGERFCPASVLFQSEFKHLGSGIYEQIEDDILGTTYFNYSEHPELY